jgi:hypothetical protein
MAFKMKNPISQIANTKSHGTNVNFAKSGVNMENMKSSPAEWAWLATAAKGIGTAAKVAGKAVATGAKVAGKAGKAVGKAVGKVAGKAGKGIKKYAESEAGKKTIGKAKDMARDVVTQKAVDSLKKPERQHVNPTDNFNVKFGNN